MATLFSEPWTRADNTALGANWTEVAGDYAILSNALRDVTQNNASVARTTTSAHAAVADVAVSTTQIATSSDGGPAARLNAGTPANGGGTNASQNYSVDCYSTLSEIYRFDPAVGNVLLRTTTVSKVANAVLRIEVTGSGATVTVKQFYNGVQQGADVSDGAATRITAAGQTGLLTWSTAAGASWDDFLVEDFASALSEPPSGSAVVRPTRAVNPSY